jgi:long-subunit acyl-CoA synthetase (AMP-forming)
VVDCTASSKCLLVVLGRIASAVRLSNGQVVSPDVLEGEYVISPLLAHVYIHASSASDHLVAIVVRPNTDTPGTCHMQTILTEVQLLLVDRQLQFILSITAFIC